MNTTPCKPLGQPLTSPKCPKPVRFFWLKGKTAMSHQEYLKLVERLRAPFKAKAA